MKFITDPSQNFIQTYAQPLDAIFRPKNVAVVGAKDTEGSVGRTILQNLMTEEFHGNIYPVNPKRDTVLGLKVYPTLSSIGKPIDLVVIVTPAPTVPKIIEECVFLDIPGAIIISAGFKEIGIEGVKLEEDILKTIKKGHLRIVGPNCLGVMNPIWGLNATFAKGMAKKGNLAFLSQSGAMCTAVLDWSFKENVGFSSFVSVGSMLDVDWGDMISYLGNDPHTEAILMYMETVGNARSFLSAAREIALDKPIIVIKPGRSSEAQKAAASHTGSLTGKDEVFDAALERVGVLRVSSIGELFNMAYVLARQPKPKGPNLAIVTNAGGPSVLATDEAVLQGAKIASLEKDTIEKMNTFLPQAWSHTNPVDILGDADPRRYTQTVELLSKDPHVDGILVILSPQDMTLPDETANGLKEYAKIPDKPILASWMGGDFVKKGTEILRGHNIPCFPYPDDAALCFAQMWKYRENLFNLYQTPRHENTFEESIQAYRATKKASVIIEDAQIQKRTILSEEESKRLFSFYGIPVVETHHAKNSMEVEKLCLEIGFPVVLKVFSHKISHKSDVGGVKLNIKTIEEAKQAFIDIQTAVELKFGKDVFEGVTVQHMIKVEGIELILGSSVDPQFGPVILFGFGGTFVEVFKDYALGFPPLTKALAKRIMEKTNIFKTFKGFRSLKPIDVDAVCTLLVQFSLMITENPRIKESDINPLIASHKGLIALDARVVLHEEKIPDSHLPKPVIRPYPIEYVEICTLKDGSKVLLRPICPEDEKKVKTFHKHLSENTVRNRYFEFMSLDQRIAHERLIRICFNDYERQIALVACIDEEIIGICRLSKISGTNFADLKLIIDDKHHNKGLGSLFIGKMIAIAKEEKIERLFATILHENTGMIHILKRYGFHCQEDPTKTYITASKVL